jgi:serine/threonine protein kinase
MAGKIHRNSLKPGHKILWYEIKEVLGQGGFGITYLAYDPNLEKHVAIKEYLPIELAVREGDFSVHPVTEDRGKQYKWGLDRFITEARTLSKFKHPNIVHVFSVTEENNTAYMVMEYEEGQDLQEKLKGRQTLEEAELLKILIPIMGGLEIVHKLGFIHRDIKPDNIIIRSDGSPVLIDFGSARQALGEKTKTLTSLISPGYAPFEQYFSKSDEQGEWTDIYGMGATLYRAVTGVAPLDAVDRSNAILKTGMDTIVTAVEIGKGKYSERFLRAIDHAIQFKIEDRPQTIAEWKKEFDLPTDPIKEAVVIEQQVTRPGTQVLPRKKTFKKPGKVSAIFLVLLLLLGAGAYFQEALLNQLQLRQQRDEIESLLTAAQAEQPAGNIALANYHRVLQLQPKNAEARLGLQSITSQLVAKARDEIHAGDFSAAEKTLVNATAILPDAANIKLVMNELEGAKAARDQKLIEEKARAEQLDSAIKKAQAAADSGQVIETLGSIEKARILGAEAQVISEVKGRLRKAIEVQVDKETSRAKQFIKQNDANGARQALKRAKEINAQLDTLN